VTTADPTQNAEIGSVSRVRDRYELERRLLVSCLLLPASFRREVVEFFVGIVVSVREEIGRIRFAVVRRARGRIR